MLGEPCMSELTSKVETTIRRHALLAPRESVLVAVSGGPDSVALLHILLELRSSWGWELAVAHVHHGLRGQDAEEELRFVEAMTRSSGLEFLCRRVAPGSLRGTGRSLQEAARVARYELLEQMREEFRATRIALGHQADDQAETVIAALIRGAGLRGLAGMPYARGHLVRPLLDVGREELLHYLGQLGIPFRQDPSNQDPRYLRVRIRQEALPLMRERLNPRIREVLCRTARLCALEEEFLSQRAESIWERLAREANGEVHIPVSEYRKLSRAMRLRLLRMGYAKLRGSDRGLGMEHAEAMDALALEDGPERWLHLPQAVRFGVSGGEILLAMAEGLRGGSFSYPVRVPGETLVHEAGLRLCWEVLDAHQEAAQGGRQDQIAMDLERIREPMVLRSPAPGDRLRPEGLGGSRKVQDLLVDAHVPRRQRWRVPILADADGVIWVVGHRLDERVSPGAHTRRVLLVRVLEAQRESRPG